MDQHKRIRQLQVSAAFWADRAAALERQGKATAARHARAKAEERHASIQTRLAELEED